LPTVRCRDSGQIPGQYRASAILQLGTVTNTQQRLTVYMTRFVDLSAVTLEVLFPATQTSCDIMTVRAATAAALWGEVNAAGSFPGTPVVQVVTGTATAATTLVVTLAALQTDSHTVGFFAVQANVTMTAGAGFTASTALTNAAPAGQMRHEAVGGQDTTVDMTTAAGQTWVGIAIEIQQGRASMPGFPGRVVQIPS
jgi:hypothetical protein